MAYFLSHSKTGTCASKSGLQCSECVKDWDVRTCFFRLVLLLFLNLANSINGSPCLVMSTMSKHAVCCLASPSQIVS